MRGKSGAAADKRHFVGDDEGGIKAHAELADEMRILGLVAGKLLKEFLGSRFGDSADISDHLVFRHADAVVGNGEGLGFLVEADTHFKLGIIFVKLRPGHRLEAQLVCGIRCIGNQFA